MKKSSVTILRVAGAIVLVAGLIVISLMTDIDRFFSVERLRTWLDELGALAPLAYMGVMTAAIVISPLPSLPLDVAAGLAFGPVLGTVYSLIGATIGAILAFLIARVIGRDFVSRIMGGRVYVETGYSDRLLSKVVFVSRLIPIVSFDVVSYGAGLTRMSLHSFTIATFFGMIPLTFIYNYFGSVLDLQSWIGLAAAGVLVILFLLLPYFVEKRNLFGLRKYLPRIESETKGATDDHDPPRTSGKRDGR